MTFSVLMLLRCFTESVRAATDAYRHGDEIITNLWLANGNASCDGKKVVLLTASWVFFKKCYVCIFPSLLCDFIFSRRLLASLLGS